MKSCLEYTFKKIKYPKVSKIHASITINWTDKIARFVIVESNKIEPEFSTSFL